MPWPIITAIVAIFVISRVLKCHSGIKNMGNLPGLRSAFSPLSLFGAVLPTTWFNPGLGWQWHWKGKVYQRCNAETISIVPYLYGPPSVCTSSIEVARQVLSTTGPFYKHEDMSAGVLLWGNNLFAVSGAEWKRHRRIVAPAFSTETYNLVWEETAKTYRQMTAGEGWDDLDEVTVPAINNLTAKLTLIIISRCGFGNPLHWDFSTNLGEGMTFAQALTIVARSPIARLAIPRWMYWLPIKWIRDLETAYVTLAKFMESLISTRRQELSAEGGRGLDDRHDIFSLMIRASETEGKLAMSDEELTGNTFLMLFAGQDTTAHTLDAAIGFLALHEEVQDDVYRSIEEIIPDKGQPVYANSYKLLKVQACFLEAARLFPPVVMMTRDTTDDIMLTTYGQDGVTGQVALNRGTRLVVDIVGIQYNPRHFPEPEVFRPSRWYGAHENEPSMFSMGSRVCIGKRFAITEAICFLTMLLQEWKIVIILREGETRSEWEKRVMTGRMGMTLGVAEIPVRLVRRQRRSS